MFEENNLHWGNEEDNSNRKLCARSRIHFLLLLLLFVRGEAPYPKSSVGAGHHGSAGVRGSLGSSTKHAVATSQRILLVEPSKAVRGCPWWHTAASTLWSQEPCTLNLANGHAKVPDWTMKHSAGWKCLPPWAGYKCRRKTACHDTQLCCAYRPSNIILSWRTVVSIIKPARLNFSLPFSFMWLFMPALCDNFRLYQSFFRNFSVNSWWANAWHRFCHYSQLQTQSTQWPSETSLSQLSSAWIF